MELFSNKDFSKVKLPEPILAVLRAVLGVGRWLTEFFTLTEEDWINAGIIVGSRRHGRIEISSKPKCILSRLSK